MILTATFFATKNDIMCCENAVNLSFSECVFSSIAVFVKLNIITVEIVLITNFDLFYYLYDIFALTDRHIDI